ncbi:MAG TPA: LptF/LptG family permease [Lacipirellulaceae bacterium]|nr:LptF/LptG family permease [Lacipirellulaceae bacterium]
MRILTRYILWEVSAVFLTTLATMTAFLFVALIGKEAVENGLGLMPILRMLPYMLPQAMQFAVPGALLLAATSVYGRVAASNEVVAIKALGISPMTLLWPVIGLGTGVSLIAVAMNDVAVSWGDGGVRRVIVESLEDIAYGRLRTVRSFTTSQLKVNVKAVAGRQLIEPIIQLTSSEGRAPSVIKATAAELHADVSKNAMTIRLYNPEAELAGWSITHPGEFVQTFPLDDFTGRGRSSRTPSYYALREIGPAKAEQTRLIERMKQEMSADAGAALAWGRMDGLAQAQWQQRERELASCVQWLDRLRTEPYRRWSNGFSCLGFVLIGAPMAIRRRHGEFWGSFFICFLPILLIYYPMLVGCVDWAKDGVIPPQTVWLGDIVLAIVGIWLMRRVIRF